jgi:hypothetical protein
VTIGTLPRVGALDRYVGRVRAKPWVAVAIVGGALLVAAWLGWAIYVASDRGLNKGIGVLVAWPALLLAAVLVCLPLVGIYHLIRPREPATDERVSATEERSAAEAEESQATETS